jgi:hypothetical protein
MHRFRFIALTALSVIALSAIATTAAQAKPAFWVIAGTMLETGKNQGVETKGGTYTLTAGTNVITCTANHTAAGAVFAGGTPGKSKETVVFEGCTVTGNGEKCGVAGGKITTEPLVNQIVGTKTTLPSGDPFLILFTPEKGSVFTKLKFKAETGGKCTLTETAVEGSVAGEALEEKEKPALLETNEAEGKSGFVNFPKTAIKTVSVNETENKMTEKAVSLKVFGKTATLVGETEVKLVANGKGEHEAWGIKTK